VGGKEKEKTPDVPLSQPDPLLAEANRLFAQIWDQRVCTRREMDKTPVTFKY